LRLYVHDTISIEQQEDIEQRKTTNGDFFEAGKELKPSKLFVTIVIEESNWVT
jgi:hypothetical protein